jgi:hypothetical protein
MGKRISPMLTHRVASHDIAAEVFFCHQHHPSRESPLCSWAKFEQSSSDYIHEQWLDLTLFDYFYSKHNRQKDEFSREEGVKVLMIQASCSFTVQRFDLIWQNKGEEGDTRESSTLFQTHAKTVCWVVITRTIPGPEVCSDSILLG